MLFLHSFSFFFYPILYSVSCIVTCFCFFIFNIFKNIFIFWFCVFLFFAIFLFWRLCFFWTCFLCCYVTSCYVFSDIPLSLWNVECKSITTCQYEPYPISFFCFYYCWFISNGFYYSHLCCLHLFSTSCII